jgi:acetyltransferase-like isoleucine patch superfamily enzyme
MRIVKRSSIKLGASIDGWEITIGEYSSIGRFFSLDGRHRLVIVNNVAISPRVTIVTTGHDPNTVGFSVVGSSVVIPHDVWIGTGAMIMPGVEIGRGAVVAVGAIVTRNVAAMDVVAGDPASSIGKRHILSEGRKEWSPLFS